MNQNSLAALVASGRASLEDMERLGASAVQEIKTAPDLLQLRVKAADPYRVDEEARSISYVVSDETPDRMGDVIRVKGWNIENYRKNPVVLWSHDGNVPPIGRATNVRRRYGPSRLTADIEFAPKEAYEFADTVFQLASRGFLKATSVGFMPTQTEEVDEKKRAKLGMGPYGQLYTGAELMEISVVSVPANPSALEEGTKQLCTEGLLNTKGMERFLQQYPSSAADVAARVRAKIRSFIDFGAHRSAFEKAEPGSLKVGDFVRWQSSGGTARGKITRIAQDGEIDVPDSSFTITGTPDDPAALIQVYRDGDPTERYAGHKFSALTKTEKPAATSAEPEVEKSPACRLAEESEADCVERKVPELIDEGMEQEQAVAVASSLCETSCEEKAQELVATKHVWAVEETEDTIVVTYGKKDAMPEEGERDFEPEEKSTEAGIVSAMASLIEQQAEQTRATRQLVDGLTDLTKALHSGLRDGSEGGSAIEPEAQEPDVAQIEQRLVEAVNDELRGFARSFKARLTSERTPQQDRT